MSANESIDLKAFTQQVHAIVGDSGLITTAQDINPYATDWRRAYQTNPLLVIRPATTMEVSRVVALCSTYNVAMVPQGGNTSLCGASVPKSNHEVVISMGRMNKIRAIDTLNDTMTVEAGCILTDLQNAAQSVDRLFPLSLASEGICQIGGNLSTNAGGVGVLKYGNTRNLALGLEVITPDGKIWNGLRGLRKDNAGYNLMHLFIGAEGTLGIITAATLKLFPNPKTYMTAIIAVANPEMAVELLAQLRADCGEQLSAFELISRPSLSLVLKNIPRATDPFKKNYSWYLLIELTDSIKESPAVDRWEDSLMSKIETGLISDVVIAKNETQRALLWALRENISEAQRIEGISIKHDIAIPVSRIPEFLKLADDALMTNYPNIRIIAFGHVGDGNIHYNCSKPDKTDNQIFLKSQKEINRIVYDIATSLNGSMSAEHGIGQLKLEEMKRYKDPVELALMSAIKKAYDPKGLMNLGKLITD